MGLRSPDKDFSKAHHDLILKEVHKLGFNTAEYQRIPDGKPRTVILDISNPTKGPKLMHHVKESKHPDGSINVPVAAALTLKGIASVLDGSNPLHSIEQYGPGPVHFTVPEGHVARTFITKE